MGYNSKLFKVDSDTGDIVPVAKKVFADYLSERTRKANESATVATGGPDEYTYNPPSPNPFPVSSTSREVSSSTILDPTANDQATFMQSQAEIDGLSKSKDFDVEKIIPPNYEPRSDVHRVLKEVSETDSSANPLSKELQRQVGIVLSRNRFSSNKKYAGGDDQNSTRLIASVLPLGKSTTEENPSEQPTSRTVNGVSYQSIFDEMREEGIRILLAGSGVPDDAIGRPSDFNSTDALATLANPLTAPFAALSNIPADEMRAKRSTSNTDRLAFSADNAEQLPNGVPDNLESRYTQVSYGTLNNPSAQFGGPLPTTMIALATILLLEASVLVLATSLIFSLITKAVRRPDFESGESGVLGSERIEGNELEKVSTFFTNLLGIFQPYESSFLSYTTAALEGVLSFTGLTAEDPIDGVLSLLGSAGYYVVMIRNLERNLQTIVDATQSNGGGFVGGLESVVGFIVALRESKAVRFVDTMARIGVVSVGKNTLEDQRASVQPGKPGEIYYDQATNRVGRSRLIETSRELSWSHRSILERVGQGGGPFAARIQPLVPDSVRFATVAYSGGSLNEVNKIKSGLDPRGEIGFTSTQIDSKTVREIENVLDSEYVPFYFQDLRTNEILPFHCFLTDLSDSYSAGYVETEAYGRVDPIQVYKGTKRAITFSFMLVATSPTDFDRMWWSINRLTMMVYPQWTAGEQLKSEDGTFSFTQPFSQVMGASPLIRIRIGELIHSNYSRFNLARTFGLGQNVKSSNPEQISEKKLLANDKEDGTVSKLQESSAAYDAPANYSIESSSPDAGALTLLYFDKTVLGNDPYKRYPALNAADLPAALAGQTFAKAKVDVVYGKIVTFIGTKPEQSKPFGGTKGGYSAIVKLDIPATKKSLFDDDKTYTHVIVPIGSLSIVEPGQPTEINPEASLTPTTLTQLEEISKNFSNPDTLDFSESPNPVVKSFESAGGRGLAGVITSLGYEWLNDNYSWETTKGRHAPKMCKVSISFSPIHDLPMGLDSDGFARAVPYPVGDTVRAAWFPELSRQDSKTNK